MLTYAICIFFFIYLFKYAEITKFIFDPIKKIVKDLQFSESDRVGWIGLKLDYLINCAFCITFWVSLIFWIATLIPFYFVLGAPVINLLVDTFIRKSSNLS